MASSGVEGYSTRSATAVPSRKLASRSLAEIVPALVRRCGGQGRTAALADLVAAWDPLVAGTPAAGCLPEKLTFPRGQQGGGTLTLAVFAGADAVALQHDQARLIERVNGHFGHAAVARIALVHRPRRARTSPAGAEPNRPPTPAEAAEIDHIVATVEDDELRERLARLGRSLYRRPRARSAAAGHHKYGGPYRESS